MSTDTKMILCAFVFGLLCYFMGFMDGRGTTRR
jgi:hypothetical protein